MKNQLIDLMVKRLNEAKQASKKQFFTEHPIKVARHFVIDHFLPTEIANDIYRQFPKPNQMRMLHSRGELKLKYSVLKNNAKLLQDLHFAIQSREVISLIEEITEIRNQMPDTSKLAGGVSALLKGHYINPHLDTSHDVDKKLYRTINTLYYVSPDWLEENGGNYELWDETITQRIIVPNVFNRMLVVETNRTSWHSVNPVLCDKPRCCIFNYFFSAQSPEGEDYYHGSSLLSFFNPLIRPRPEQKIRRMLTDLRNRIFNIPAGLRK